MLKTLWITPAFAAFVFAGAFDPSSAKQADAKWKLVWSDEFDGKDIDRGKWDFDIGNGFFNYEANTHSECTYVECAG
jgi:beta-glucanase (GH16 family)